MILFMVVFGITKSALLHSAHNAMLLVSNFHEGTSDATMGVWRNLLGASPEDFSF